MSITTDKPHRATMRILLLYDNFVRDFRGLLLLKHLLTAMGHRVWIKASWNKPLKFAELMDIDVLVAGQIAETATHYFGKFAKEHNIRFVLNSSENVSIPKNFEMFITYNTNELNQDIIDLQTIATKDIHEFVVNHEKVKEENKTKYKLLGFPRLDLIIDEGFRQVERQSFKAKYGLHNRGKVYLFISSFLLDGAFDGVPQKDLERWDFDEIKKRTNDLLILTVDILDNLIHKVLGKDDLLLIKKHPWDCSSFFAENFASDKCIVLDKNDYIVPCIDNADIILHTYSTAAVDAWILNKKTISILLEKYKNTFVMNHLRHELVATSFDELARLLKNYPAENPSIKSLELFAPNLDGRATVRLAEEIDKLTPHPQKTKFRSNIRKRLRSELRNWLFDRGFFKLDLSRYAKPNTKAFDFYSWENQRAAVIRAYDKCFKKYVKEYIKTRQ